MKAPLLFLSCLLAVPAAHAKPRSSRASYVQMQEDVQDFSRLLSGIEGCDFHLEETATDGMILTMISGAKGSVSLTVSPESEITLDSGDEREDGSFSKSYKVNGAGELDVVHADDAFDHAFLTGPDGRTVSCEVDY